MDDCTLVHDKPVPRVRIASDPVHWLAREHLGTPLVTAAERKARQQLHHFSLVFFGFLAGVLCMMFVWALVAD